MTRSEIKRLAVLAALMLGWSSSVLAAVTPKQSVQPLKETQAHENTSPLHEAHQVDQKLHSEREDGVKVDEIQTDLQETLMEALVSFVSKQQTQKYVVQTGDSLSAIASRHGVTLPLLKSVNHLEKDHIYPQQQLIIPAVMLQIEIDKSENLLRLFNDQLLVKTYPVATGDQGITPIGDYTIANRLISPTWYYQGYAIPPGDPDYPLGTRWLGLSKRGYGIHGTNEPDSIGKQISHGCIRMYNENVEELFDVVSIGTVVTIIE